MLLIGVAAGCGSSKQTLNILVNPEFVDPGIIADFERQFQCRVVQDTVDSPESMIAKLAVGGTTLYDIVVPDNNSMLTMVKRGLLTPLRRDNIPNLTNIDPQFANSPTDPENRYGAPYTWGFIGLYARKSKNKPLDESLSLLFDPAKQPGPFILVDYQYPCINAALLFNGCKLGSTNLQELARARDLLIQVKHRAQGFADFIACRNRVLSREAVIALVGNQDGAIGMNEDPETYFFLPREGGDAWFNNLSIPAKSRHRDLAEKFINHLLDAKNAARNSLFTRTSTPNKAALDLIPPSEKNNAALYPTAEVMSRLQWSPPLNESARLYDELWVRFKAQ